MAISFSTQATSNTGKTNGVLKQNMTPYSGSFSQQQYTPAPITNKSTTGTNPGVLSSPSYTHTTTTNQTGGTTSKPTPNPSVLAQQQALNKQGAGLVEDGIAGPLTQAAISKYGTASSTQVQPPKPISSANPTEQIQNVGQAGQQTGNEATTFQGLVGQSQAPGQAYTEAMNNYNKAKQELADYESKLAETNKNISSQGISLESARGQEANIGQAATAEHAALQGAVNAASNVLNAANAQQGLQVQAGTAAQQGAQTQAQRGLTGQTTVLNAGLLQPTSIGQVPFSAVTGGQGQMIGGQGGLSQLGALQQQQQQGAQTQNMIGAFNQAKPLIETAKQQIASAGFNISPIALVNQLQQYVNKGIAPTAEYANIFNTLSEIATTISPVLGAQGAQTDLKTMISQEFIPKLMQGQDIGMVLDNIEKNALAKIEANKSTAQGQTLAVPTSGSQTGGFATAW